MGDTIRCEECGAAAKVSDEGPERDKFCRFCGAAFRIVEVAPSVAAPETRPEERDRRFGDLRDHPDVRRALRSAPSAAPAMAKHGGGLFVLFAILGVALVMFSFQCSVMDGMGSRPVDQSMPSGFPGGPSGGFPMNGGGSGSDPMWIFKIVPLVIIGGILFQILRSGTKAASVASSPTRSWLAWVVDETTETRGSRDHRRDVHVVTLEEEDGDRRSFEVGSRIARRVARDDMGVAHTRGSELLGFTRVDV